MSATVFFYALRQKFLQREEDMPAQARQVIYQTLALGHHIGVIDCLNVVLQMPYSAYQAWLARFPEGEARSKLAGLLRFGEITIDATHTHLLAHALDKLPAGLGAEEKAWSARLMQALHDIEAEPALYLMVRRRED